MGCDLREKRGGSIVHEQKNEGREGDEKEEEEGEEEEKKEGEEERRRGGDSLARRGGGFWKLGRAG